MPGRRERKRDLTRQSLITAATRLFAEHGIFATTIEQITETADLGKGTFYKHFSGRDEVVAAVVRRGFARLLESVRDRTAGQRDIGEVLRILMDLHVRFFSEDPEYLVLLHQARGWLKVVGGRDNPVRAEFVAYVGELAKALAGTAQGGDMARDEIDHMARTLAGTVSGTFSFERIAGDGRLDAENLAADLRRMGAYI